MADRLTNLGYTPEAARDKAESFRNSSADEQTKATKELLRMEEMKRRNGSSSYSPGNARRRGGRRSSSAGRIVGAGRTINGFVSGVSHDLLGTAGGLAQQGGIGLAQAGYKDGGEDMNKNLMALGGAVALIATTLVVVNEVSKQYEKQVPQLVETTAMLGKFGRTADEQSGKFRSTMAEISKSAATYGYTLEQGEATIQTLVKSGGNSGSAQGTAARLMAESKSLGLSAPSQSLARLSGLGEKYGYSGADEYALGSANYLGMGTGRTEEQADALSSMFDTATSSGSALDSEAVAGTQNWIGRALGPQGKGAGGSALYSQLSGAVRGSTGLNSETDILKYQAAHVAGEDYTKTMERLEKGFTVDGFKKFKTRISGGTDDEQIENVRKAYGVNYTQADKMLHAENDDAINHAYKNAGGPGGAIAGTNEEKNLNIQEVIAQKVRVLGEVALDGKVNLLSGMSESEEKEFQSKNNSKVKPGDVLMNKDLGALDTQERAALRSPTATDNEKSAATEIESIFKNKDFKIAFASASTADLATIQKLATPAVGEKYMNASEANTLWNYLEKMVLALQAPTTTVVRGGSAR